MEPYATAAQPGPLNGNRPAVGGGRIEAATDFFYRYRWQLFQGVSLLIYTIIIWNVASSGRKKRR